MCLDFVVVKTIIPLSSPFFLVPAIQRQNKTEKKWNTTGLESCLQNLKACIIGSSKLVFVEKRHMLFPRQTSNQPESGIC